MNYYKWPLCQGDVSQKKATTLYMRSSLCIIDDDYQYFLGNKKGNEIVYQTFLNLNRIAYKVIRILPLAWPLSKRGKTFGSCCSVTSC